MALHVFVAMPYGTKEGINFNKVYTDYIKPALEGESYDVFRADEELSAGNIRADMFQELLLADLVVVDLSIDNPNVWYELGVRHALRARGVVLIQCQRESQPFDVYTDRKLRYHLKDGLPDPAFLEEDKNKLAVMARETMAAWRGKKISPVFYHLPYLREPDWKELRVGQAQEFWEKQKEWESRIEVARKSNRPGDILVLAEETPVQVLRLEAYRKAGKALHKLGQVRFALEQYEKALGIDPTDLESRRQKGILLGRKGAYHEKIVWLENLQAEHPDDPETLALLGRVRKEAWLAAWRRQDATPEQMRNDAAASVEFLREAIRPYEDGFLKDPRLYYSGINAFALSHLRLHLTGAKKSDELKALEGALRWAVQSALARETPTSKDYWARVTLGGIEILVAKTQVVQQAYRNAVMVAENDWFALDSSRQQLAILRDLQFRPTQVEAGLAIFDKALEKLKAPWVPRRVFLFSGHMIDAPDRPVPRFPAMKETIAAQKIAEALAQLGAGPEDIAFTQGACGGDLLFTEACLQRGVKVHWLQPFDEPDFIRNSVINGGEGWRNRYFDAKAKLAAPLRSAPEELGESPQNADGYAYERCNLWLLYTALACGVDKVRFICLWNGGSGDGLGGTAHMYNEVNERTGRVIWIDTRQL